MNNPVLQTDPTYLWEFFWRKDVRINLVNLEQQYLPVQSPSFPCSIWQRRALVQVGITDLMQFGRLL